MMITDGLVFHVKCVLTPCSNQQLLMPCPDCRGTYRLAQTQRYNADCNVHEVGGSPEIIL